MKIEVSQTPVTVCSIGMEKVLEVMKQYLLLTYGISFEDLDIYDNDGKFYSKYGMLLICKSTMPKLEMKEIPKVIEELKERRLTPEL